MSSSGIHFSLDTLPERYRVQIARKLSDETVRTDARQDAPEAVKGGSCDSGAISDARLNVAKRKSSPRAAKKRTPNKTEERFNRFHLNGKGEYEAVAFNFAPGCRYTPDFCVWDDTGRMTAYEVKGSYPLPSEGRARTAFLTCRERFPHVTFRWLKLEKSGVFVELHKE